MNYNKMNQTEKTQTRIVRGPSDLKCCNQPMGYIGKHRWRCYNCDKIYQMRRKRKNE